MRPVAYTSRVMVATEQIYYHIEKEALTMTCILEALSDYMYGMQFHEKTDRKPLVCLLRWKKIIDEVTKNRTIPHAIGAVCIHC